MKRALLAVAVCMMAWALWPRDVRGHETLTTTVLFEREIVRILNKHCVMCHSANNVSFPLETYEQTWLRGRSIRAHVLARQMPPWAGVPGYGQFINDNGLTLRETQFIVSWVEGLGPRNAGTVFLNVVDENVAPPQPVRAHMHVGWQLGEPDLTRQLAANTIEAGQPTVIKRTVIDLGLTSERWLRGVEYLPGDRRVVRAAFFTVEETKQWLGSWTPWYGADNLSPGAAFRLPRGSRIVAEIHYRGAPEQVVDQGTIGLFFADQPGSNSPSDLVLEATGQVPARTAAHRFRAETRLAEDTYALALRPDIQAGVKSIEVSARTPNGGTEILLFAQDIAIDWPTPYVFKKPVFLAKGTELSVTAYYANEGVASQPGGIRLTVKRGS
jgi:hypothetical protein